MGGNIATGGSSRNLVVNNYMNQYESGYNDDNFPQ